MVSAKASAWLSDWNPTLAPPPPRLMVRALPLDWQVWISAAKNEQSRRPVPEKVESIEVLHVCGPSKSSVNPYYDILTLPKSRTGAFPVP